MANMGAVRDARTLRSSSADSAIYRCYEGRPYSRLMASREGWRGLNLQRSPNRCDLFEVPEHACSAVAIDAWLT